MEEIKGETTKVNGDYKIIYQNENSKLSRT